MSKNSQFSDDAVVDLAKARTKLRSRGGRASSASLKNELSEINLLLDKGLSIEARSRLSDLISAAHHDAEVLAEARLALSIALEMHGDYKMSLQAVAMYEPDEAKVNLPIDLALKLGVQVAVAYNYCGDHPKAIALLKVALRESLEQHTSAAAGHWIMDGQIAQP